MYVDHEDEHDGTGPIIRRRARAVPEAAAKESDHQDESELFVPEPNIPLNASIGERLLVRGVDLPKGERRR